MQSKKIIYSPWLATKLIEQGFTLSYTMPNPNKLKYTCWVFPLSEELEQAIEAAIA